MSDSHCVNCGDVVSAAFWRTAAAEAPSERRRGDTEGCAFLLLLVLVVLEDCWWRCMVSGTGSMIVTPDALYARRSLRHTIVATVWMVVNADRRSLRQTIVATSGWRLDLRFAVSEVTTILYVCFTLRLLLF